MLTFLVTNLSPPVYEIIKEPVRANLERSRDLIRSELPFPQKLIGIISSKLDMAEKMNNEIIEKLMRWMFYGFLKKK